MQVTMSMEDFKQIEHARDQALSEVARLRAELIETKLNAVVEGSDTNLRRLVTLTRALLDCTRFAVGQLPPEVNKGWPIASVKRAAELLTTLPDSTVDDISIAAAFSSFAIECERAELIRSEQV